MEQSTSPTPFMQGLSEFITKEGYHVIELCEVHGGKTSTHKCTWGNRCQNSYSVAKAFTMTAIGILADRGLLSVEDRICTFFPEYSPTDPRFCEATIAHALSHRLGFAPGFLDIDCADGGTMAFGEDFLSFIYAQELLCAPGEERSYTDCAFYLLARIVERVSGQAFGAFLWQNLLWPMAFTEAAWASDPQGHAMGATGLYIRTTDMAKLGVLYLQRGIYAGKRLLSEAWIESVFVNEWEFSRLGEGIFGKGGMFGQQLLMDLCSDRVVAWHAFDDRHINKSLIQFCAEYGK